MLVRFEVNALDDGGFWRWALGRIRREFYPFCSERCKIIDLGNWASEKYVVSSPLDPFAEEENDEI